MSESRPESATAMICPVPVMPWLKIVQLVQSPADRTVAAFDCIGARASLLRTRIGE